MERAPDWGFKAKWPSEVGRKGFTAVPNALLQYYAELNLTPTEFLILVNIESYRWDANRLAYPSVETLAQRTGLNERTVTRNITSLQNEREVLTRYRRKGNSNEYSLEPLLFRLIDLIRADEHESFSRQIKRVPKDIYSRFNPPYTSA